MRRRISLTGCVRPSVGPSVRPSVRLSRVIFKRVLGASCAVYPALFILPPFLQFTDFVALTGLSDSVGGLTLSRALLHVVLIGAHVSERDAPGPAFRRLPEFNRIVHIKVRRINEHLVIYPCTFLNDIT